MILIFFCYIYLYVSLSPFIFTDTHTYTLHHQGSPLVAVFSSLFYNIEHRARLVRSITCCSYTQSSKGNIIFKIVLPLTWPLFIICERFFLHIHIVTLMTTYYYYCCCKLYILLGIIIIITTYIDDG